MNIALIKKISIISLLCFAFQANAAQDPIESPKDARVKYVQYVPNDVIKLLGHYRYSILVEFDKDEYVLAVDIGDSLAWQHNVIEGKPYLMTLKPLLPNAETNITIISSEDRIYSFELRATEADAPDAPDITYRLKIIDPNKKPKNSANNDKKKPIKKQRSYPGLGEFGSRKNTFPTFEDQEVNHAPDFGYPTTDPTRKPVYNREYHWSGDSDLVPVEAYDNTQKTFLRFPDYMEAPAIFIRTSDGTERVINGSRHRDFIVLDHVVEQLVLRRGNLVTCLFNLKEKEPDERVAQLLQNSTKKTIMLNSN